MSTIVAVIGIIIEKVMSLPFTVQIHGPKNGSAESTTTNNQVLRSKDYYLEYAHNHFICNQSIIYRNLTRLISKRKELRSSSNLLIKKFLKLSVPPSKSRERSISTTNQPWHRLQKRWKWSLMALNHWMMKQRRSPIYRAGTFHISC